MATSGIRKSIKIKCEFEVVRPMGFHFGYRPLKFNAACAPWGEGPCPQSSVFISFSTHHAAPHGMHGLHTALPWHRTNGADSRLHGRAAHHIPALLRLR